MSLRLVVVGLMLTTALALGLLAYRLGQPARTVMAAPAAAPALLLLGYLHAAHALPAGTLAREEDFSVKTAAPGAVPAGAVLDAPEARAAIRGALIRHYLDAGAPITSGDLLRPRDRGFLAAVLAPATRAVSIGVDAVTGVAGLVWPGDRVDVILTQAMDQAVAPLARRVLSETVLRDVRVIAVDQEIVQGGSPTAGVAGRLARTVTLEVTAEQAEQLTVAAQLGRLALAIRAAAVGAQPEVAARETVFGGDVSPALSSASAPVGTRIQLIQGDQRSEVTFR